MSARQPGVMPPEHPTGEKIARLIEIVGDELERIAIGDQDMQLPLTVAGGIFARAAAIRGKDEAAFAGALGTIAPAYRYYRDRQKAAGHAATAEAPPP